MKVSARCFVALLSGLLVAAVASTADAQAIPANPYNYTRTTAYTYDPTTNKVTSTTAEPGNLDVCVQRGYQYDAYGNPRQITTQNCSGASQASTFVTGVTTYDYTAPSAATYPSGMFPTTATSKISAALQESETRQFDARFGEALQIVGPNGLPTKWTVDDFGRKTREIYANNTSVVWYYCVLPGGGRDTSSNSPSCPTPQSGEVPADAAAFVHSVALNTNQAPMGPFHRVYSDRLGRILRTVSQSFDGSGQPSAVAGSLVVTDTVYSPYGTVALQSQPYFLATGASTTTGQNAVGASSTSYDVLGRVTVQYSADPQGKAGQVSFGGGSSVGYGTYGSQQVAATAYDYNGLDVTITNDKRQVKKVEHDAVSQSIRVTDNTGAQLAYQRDAFGNLLATKDALQNTITTAFDIAGRKVRLNDPDAGTWLYCYDAVGHVVAQQNATMRGASAPGACPANPNSGIVANSVGGWSTFAYDALGRRTDRYEPEYRTTWSYDTYADGSPCNKGMGKLCEVSGNGFDRKEVFDNLGRPINEVTTAAAGPAFPFAVGYDSTTGRISSKTYPTGLQLTYSYTTLGFAQGLALGTSATVNPLPSTPGGTPGSSVSLPANYSLWQASAVDAWGKVETQAYGNGVSSTAAFEAQTGRAISLQAVKGSTTVMSHQYFWDSLDNLIQRTQASVDDAGDAITEDFNYDDGLNRLTGYQVYARAIPGLERDVALQYNALGMLLYKSDVGNYAYGAQGANAVHPHALQSVTAAGTTSFQYDGNGNLTSATAGKYSSISYNSFNLPDSQTGALGPNGSPQYVWLYNEDHARIEEIRTVSSGTYAGKRTTWYLHPDNIGGLSFESEVNAPSVPSASNPAVTSNRHFLTAGGQVIGVLVSTGGLPQLSAGQTAPAVASLGINLVKVEYWHHDHLGSLSATTDHTGAITARYAYDPFGKRRNSDGTYDALGTVTADWNPAVNYGTSRGYTGHEHLDDIGLIHMNGRLFDPTLGVFLQADHYVTDPSNLQAFGRYTYCLNNPLTCTDPSGFEGEAVRDPLPTGSTGDFAAAGASKGGAIGFGWETVICHSEDKNCQVGLNNWTPHDSTGGGNATQGPGTQADSVSQGLSDAVNQLVNRAIADIQGTGSYTNAVDMTMFEGDVIPGRQRVEVTGQLPDLSGEALAGFEWMTAFAGGPGDPYDTWNRYRRPADSGPHIPILLPPPFPELVPVTPPSLPLPAPAMPVTTPLPSALNTGPSAVVSLLLDIENLLSQLIDGPGVDSLSTFAKPPKNAYDPDGPKAPGKPPEEVGFDDPKGGESWVQNPNPGKGGNGYGWLDSEGNVWVPTGPGPLAHGGPHWDVQSPGGGYRNVYPPKN